MEAIKMKLFACRQVRVRHAHKIEGMSLLPPARVLSQPCAQPTTHKHIDWLPLYSLATYSLEVVILELLTFSF